jgi:hypothetical protein
MTRTNPAPTTPFTVEELARRWRRDPETIRRYLRTGRLRGGKPGGGPWLVSADEAGRFERAMGL